MGAEHELLERKVKVVNNLGLHARVATRMAQAMQNYSCKVTLVKDDVEVNAKSVLGLLLLAAAPGTELLVRAQGPDGQEAVEEIKRLIEDDNLEAN
ncbi:MAG: HPr family phosphocarrier protein [Deltaproteobacteria bacterium]